MTNEEKNEIIQRVLLEINSRSKSLDELQAIETLDDTESLPTYKKGTQELVKVPIELIAKPAIDAADDVRELIQTSSTNMADLKKALDDAEARLPEIQETIDNAVSTTEKLDSMIVPISEEEYANLRDKNPDSLYVCYEEDGVEVGGSEEV